MSWGGIGIENLGFVEHVVAGRHAVEIEIGSIFLGAPLRHQPPRRIRAAIKHPGDFDLRVLFVQFAKKPSYSGLP
jgi:hypothetical protein